MPEGNNVNVSVNQCPYRSVSGHTGSGTSQTVHDVVQRSGASLGISLVQLKNSKVPVGLKQLVLDRAALFCQSALMLATAAGGGE